MDSDGEFTVSDGASKQKKSRLSKKKNKENSKKLYTSTQGEIPEPIIGRGGRSIRKTKEELAFQAHLEAALKLSSEEASSSSGEVLPPGRNKTLSTDDVLGAKEFSTDGIDRVKEISSEAIRGEKIVSTEHIIGDNRVSADDILEVGDSQDTVSGDDCHGASSAETIVQSESNNLDIGIDTIKVIEGHTNKSIRDSDDEFETEVAKKESQKLVLKRKVGESWVVNGSKKNKKEETINNRVPRRAKAKYNVGSSDSEKESSDDNDFDGGTDDDESDEEFVLKKQKKAVNKKVNPPESTTNKITKVSTSGSSPLKEPVRPLGPHNSNTPTVSDISSPLPTRQNLAYTAPRSLRVDGTLAPAAPKMSAPGSTFNSPGPSRLGKPVTSSSALSHVTSSITSGSSFQSPVPSRTSRLVTPSSKSITSGSSFQSPVPSCLIKPVASSAKTHTPGTTSSITSLLSSLPSCLTKSTTTPGLKSVTVPSSGVARSNTPKMPAWTPPSRVLGKVGSISSPAPSSPAIGMRVGLSRNWKSPKPLHSVVKNQ